MDPLLSIKHIVLWVSCIKKKKQTKIMHVLGLSQTTHMQPCTNTLSANLPPWVDLKTETRASVVTTQVSKISTANELQNYQTRHTTAFSTDTSSSRLTVKHGSIRIVSTIWIMDNTASFDNWLLISYQMVINGR